MNSCPYRTFIYFSFDVTKAPSDDKSDITRKHKIIYLIFHRCLDVDMSRYLIRYTISNSIIGND